MTLSDTCEWNWSFFTIAHSKGLRLLQLVRPVLVARELEAFDCNPSDDDSLLKSNAVRLTATSLKSIMRPSKCSRSSTPLVIHIEPSGWVAKGARTLIGSAVWSIIIKEEKTSIKNFCRKKWWICLPTRMGIFGIVVYDAATQKTASQSLA